MSLRFIAPDAHRLRSGSVEITASWYGPESQCLLIRVLDKTPDAPTYTCWLLDEEFALLGIGRGTSDAQAVENLSGQSILAMRSREV